MVAKLAKDFPMKILVIILCNSNILENRFKYTCTWAANMPTFISDSDRKHLYIKKKVPFWIDAYYTQQGDQ